MFCGQCPEVTRDCDCIGSSEGQIVTKELVSQVIMSLHEVQLSEESSGKLHKLLFMVLCIFLSLIIISNIKHQDVLSGQ